MNKMSYETTSDCLRCANANLCFTVGLTEKEILAVEAVAQPKRILHKGDYLFREGDKFDCIYAIRSGSFKTVRSDTEGNAQVQGFYFVGELIGFGAIADEQYQFSAIALETSSICAIPFQDLFALTVKIPHLQRQILNLMSQQLNPSQHISLNSIAEQRLAFFLLNLASRKQRRGLIANEFCLSMPYQDIANYLGLASETISRLFSQFKKDHIIHIQQRRLVIHDVEALKKLMAQC